MVAAFKSGIRLSWVNTRCFPFQHWPLSHYCAVSQQNLWSCESPVSSLPCGWRIKPLLFTHRRSLCVFSVKVGLEPTTVSLSWKSSTNWANFTVTYNCVDRLWVRYLAITKCHTQFAFVYRLLTILQDTDNYDCAGYLSNCHTALICLLGLCITWFRSMKF